MGRRKAKQQPEMVGSDRPPEVGPRDPSGLPEEWEVSRFIKVLRHQAPELAERYKVKWLGVFGSYVRNEQHEGSDLDVLVEFEKVPSLLGLIDLEMHLSELLGVKVDLVTRDSLKPGIDRYILSEVVPV